MVLPQGLLILAAALAVWYGVGRGLAPLVNLRKEIEHRSHRDLSALSEQQAPIEVQPLIRAMNDLLARLGAALTAQQRFIADAAHQLRTPLAGIKTQTELALRQSQPGDAFLLKEMLNNLLDNAIRYTQPGGRVTVRITADTPIRPIANCHIVGIQLRLCLFIIFST